MNGKPVQPARPDTLLPQDAADGGSARPVSASLSEAERAFGAGRVADAIGAARTALRENPSDGAVRLALARYVAAAGRDEEAMQLLFALLRTEERFAAESNTLLGRLLEKNGNYEQAAEFLARGAQAGPDGTPGAGADRMAAGRDGDAQRQILQAERCLDQGRFGRAADILEAIPDGGRHEERRRSLLAASCLRLGRTDEALRIVQTMLAADPRSAAALRTAGSVLLALGRREEADAYLNRLSAADPSTEREVLQQAVLFGEAGRHEEAYALLHRLHAAHIPSAESLFAEGAAAYNSGRTAEAERLFTDLCRIDEPPVAASYYLRLVRRENEEQCSVLPYHFALPAAEVRRRQEFIDEGLRCGFAQAFIEWAAGGEYTQTLLWATQQGDEWSCLRACRIVAGFADTRAEEALRGVLLRRSASDALKREVAVLLARNGARPPYPGYLGGEFIWVSPEPEEKTGEQTAV